MTKFYATVLSFVANDRVKREERGATAVEYGLLVALIAAVIVAVVALLGGSIKDAFTDTNNAINTPAQP